MRPRACRMVPMWWDDLTRFCVWYLKDFEVRLFEDRDIGVRSQSPNLVKVDTMGGLRKYLIHQIYLLLL